MATSPSVSCLTYAKSSREQNVDIIKFTNSEEWNLLSKTCDNTESGDEFDDNSTIPPLIRK